MEQKIFKLQSGVAMMVLACLLQACAGGGSNGNATDSTAIKNDSAAIPSPVGNPGDDRIANYRGIDVSRYNGDLVAEIDGTDSLTFIVCKASEGLNYRDPDYDKNRQIIKQKGMLSGNYHFYHTADDPTTQANFFWSTIQTAGVPDMPPIVDIEQGSLPQPA